MKTSKTHQIKGIIKKGGLVLIACSILCTGVIGVSAYFSDQEEVVNTFTVGKISIDHREDIWDKLPDEEKEDITPNKEIAKDPKVENTGINDAFVFQVVEIPCATVVTANEDGTKNEETLTDLFTYTANNGWTLVKTEDVKEDGEVIAHRYSYAYGSATSCTTLEPGAITPTLFDSVRFANIVEEQGLEGTTQSILIQAYGIQTTDLGENDTVSPLDVLSIITNQV